MDNLKDKGSWKYKTLGNEEQQENKKQLLGFDEVNFEQKREVYDERKSTIKKDDEKSPKGSPESRG
jgi:hypothetical protein